MLRRIPGAALLLIVGLLAAGAAVGAPSPRPGVRCHPVGATAKTAGGARLRCVRKGKRLVWAAAARKRAAPAPATTAPQPQPQPSEAFIVGLPFDLSQVARISKFRSCSGHDYSAMDTEGQQESDRSMKHYVLPLDSLIGTTNQITVFAPFDGTVAVIGSSPSYGNIGTDVWLTATSNPTWALTLFHVTPSVQIGQAVTAGQLIGYANLSHASVDRFDIALERWLGPDGKPLTLDQAHQQYGDYSGLLHRGQLDSFLNHLAPEPLATLAGKGVTAQSAIVSKSDRDAAPCTFGNSSENPADWIQVSP